MRLHDGIADVKLAMIGGDEQSGIVGEGDVVILKVITPPSMSDFDDIIKEARRQARQAGMKRSDVTAALRAVRAGR